MGRKAVLPPNGHDDSRRRASVLRSLAFVEESMRDEAGVEDMARAACYSLFHFVRVFTAALGMGPYDYLVRRRVACVALELGRDARAGLVELAVEYCLGAPDTLSRACKRALGMTPTELKGMGPPPWALEPINESTLDWILGARPRRVPFGESSVALEWDSMPDDEAFARAYAMQVAFPLASVFAREVEAAPGRVVARA
jgi:AraC-like DNA-binding protein